MMDAHVWPHRRPTGPRGFTLLEAALATVIIGVAFTAVLTLLAKGTMANKSATEISTAIHLAGSVRELTFRRPFTDPTSPRWGPDNGETPAGSNSIEDLDGASISPPIDANGVPIASCSEWTQAITVKSVDTARVDSVQPSNDLTTFPMARVTCRVLRGGNEVLTQSWLVVNTQ